MPNVASVDDVPVCPGCGLMAHITHGDICVECFDRRERWLGGGAVRVVAHDGDVHETPLCPDFEGGVWYLWRDEDALYGTLSPTTDREYCEVCRYSKLSAAETEEVSG
ncbi:hypothetical protein C453_12736 [Haloferax elongans ATCC BAA-1513]|uniref:Uncharacterized protein n=1 Tax=Haloferax elongans ATCC BAA-1513 TaxID=1230453 RepID=M0HL14_HALEO|nr:hypothetical protein [Haloferax elongans]ELZ84412.1 hypothetical protein C453_12736 [Haloferax elongans ATCC BAA-1513]